MEQDDILLDDFDQLDQNLIANDNKTTIDTKASLNVIVDEKAIARKELTKSKGGSFIALCIFYMKQDLKLTFLILVSITIAALSTAITPKFTQQLMMSIGYALSGQSVADWWGLPWEHVVYILIGQLVVLALFIWLAHYSTGMLGKKIEIDIRRRAMEKFVAEDMSYYSDKKIGEMLTKVISDSQILGDQTAVVPATFITAIFTLVATIIVSLTINWQLTLITVAIYLIIMLCMGLAFVPLKSKMYGVRDTITKINGNVMDRINTIKLIKSSGTEDFESEFFIDQHKEYFNQAQKMNISISILITILIVGISSVQVAIIVFAALIYGTTNDQFGTIIVTFLTSVSVMSGPIWQLIRVTIGMIQASTASQRIHELLIAPVRFDNNFKSKSGVHIKKIKGDIKFEGLEFAYPEKPDNVILPKFDFTFKEGKSYAFVGTTGAGKSTISRLLLRFYDPSQGKVLINNNIDLKDVYLSSYLQHVGYVEQEPAILLGNIFDNVKYGLFDATDKQVIAACKKADLHNLIMTWPDGYKTILGERGFMLSGGQKQRLVIARMFLKNPQLLILDEATSALDNIVEKEIQVKLDELMKGRTTVSIAHRLSTIKNVDEILVLAPGQGIVQRGTFKELKKVPGHFKDLYDAGQTPS